MDDGPPIVFLSIEQVLALHEAQLDRYGGQTAAALVFLKLNGILLEVDPDAYADITLLAAQGKLDKLAIAAFLEQHSQLEAT